MTDIDSGFATCALAKGVGLDLNVSTLLWIEPDLSRILETSGDDSREAEGGGVFRLIEFARSATEGELLDSRTLPLRMEKNDVAEPEVVTAALGVVAAGLALDNFSKALIRCEMPDPRLTFFATGLDSC